MAEAVVSIVINGLVPLGNLVVQQANFLSGVSDQIELAQSELLLMRSFLKDADTKQEDDEVVRFWVSLVREAAYDLEDAVESFVLKVAFRRGGGMKIAFKRFSCICREGVDRYQIGSEIESITTKLSKLRLSMQSYEIKQTKGREGESSSSRQRERRQTYDHVTDDHDVVGLEKKVEELADHLVKVKQNRIVSIWGMGGLGKTTLAKQVYNHKSVKYHFDCFAWVCVSQQYEATSVMKEIFIKLSKPSDVERQGIANLNNDEIAEKLCNFQRGKKCLVVLDDIWTLDAWKSLKNGFPVNEETESQVMLTTRIQEVASVAKEIGFLYKSQALNPNESWDLFQKIAISKTDETDMEAKEALGKEMLQHCGGLPLAIIVLAGLLARKETVHEWVTVRENVDVYIRRGSDLEREYKGQNFGGASWVLALSYENLPYRLKLCFLYLSQFPEDYEIPVTRLTHMWIAEGFISTTSTELMEDVAYSCLSELVERCMVQVGNIGLTGKIKTCRLHDLMRDLCLSKAKEENFIHIVNSVDTRTSAAPTGRVRRLAIYFDDESCNLVIPTRDFHLRSLLCFAPQVWFMDVKSGLRTLFKDFGLLRVLKFENMLRCGKLPSTIGNLVHLRFLSLKGSGVRQLPSSVENLVCLQTLDLRRTRMKIPNVFKKMQHLRHLYLPDDAINVSEKLSLARLSSLQTLVKIDIGSCDLNAFAELSSLRKLSITARESSQLTRLKKLEEILKSRNITYNHLRSLSLLMYCGIDIPMEVVLRCRFIYKLSLRGTSTELPEALLSNANLTKIQLKKTNLKENQIQILEKLPKLKVLRFLFNVFSSLTSNTLVFSSGGFLKLESLSLVYLDNLHEWKVEQGAMPSLCRLNINFCYGLKGVPDGLQYITTLKEITIDRMESEFCNRLRESGEDFYKVKHVPSIMITNIQYWEREEAERQRADAGMPDVVVEAEESIVTELNETTTGVCINNHPLSMRSEQENEAETELPAEVSELVVAHEESTVEDAGPSHHTHTRYEQENEVETELAAVSKVEESSVKNGEPN